jgi:hypothetical protein
MAEPQTVHITQEYNAGESPSWLRAVTKLVNYKVPVVRHICQESRAIAEKLHDPITIQSTRLFFFNNSTDILYIDCKPTFLGLGINLTFCNHLRVLRLQPDLLKDASREEQILSTKALLKETKRHFKGLERLEIAVCEDEYSVMEDVIRAGIKNWKKESWFPISGMNSCIM